MTAPQAPDDNILLMRPLRILFDEGKPASSCTILSIDDPSSDQLLAIGVLSKTDNGRTLFWPLLPTQPTSNAEFSDSEVIDHITLDPSRKMHVTWYKNGESKHHSESWKAQTFPGSGLAIWFKLLIKWSLIDDQPRQYEGSIRLPRSDEQRRMGEFDRWVNRLAIARMKTPPRSDRGDFLFCVFYVVVDSAHEEQLTSDMIFCGGGIDKLVAGWPKDEPVQVMPVKFCIGDTELVAASSCPPGCLNRDVVMGFPRAANAPSVAQRL